MAVRDDFTPGEKLKAADLNDTFADKISNNDGYAYKTSIYYTTVGTSDFVKSSYDYLRAIRVRVQGAGGAGGGTTAAGVGQISIGASGGAGAYAESFITDIASLPGTVTVTVGAAGTAAVAANGTDGSASSFGTIVSANGGDGGNQGGAAAPLTAATPGATPYVTGAFNTTVGTGDIVIGGKGTDFIPYASAVAINVRGGDSVLGCGANASASVGNENGQTGTGYGSGGSGGMSTASTGARAGGAGRQGIVIVDLFG